MGLLIYINFLAVLYTVRNTIMMGMTTTMIIENLIGTLFIINLPFIVIGILIIIDKKSAATCQKRQ